MKHKVSSEVIEAHIRESQMPVRYRARYRRAMTSNSRKDAISAFCAECQGFEQGAVEACTAQACPLWRFR